MKKKNLQKLFIVLIAIICFTLLFFFFKDIMIDLIKYEIEGNKDAASALLKDKGIIGMISVVLIQAFQMVVVFIPAEFIQISTGISFPWYISIGLLAFGVFVGATLIYILVNFLKFDGAMFSKSSNKINNLVKRDKKKNRNAQSLMYILFVTPIVPFGALCYFGATSKMSYRRYILTCVTGVLPSILTSIFVGNAFMSFISSDIPIIYLVLIALAFVIILFAVSALLINKLYFVKGAGTPDSIYYRILLFIFERIVKSKSKPTFDRKNLSEIDDPFILLSNHGSFFDVYYLSKLVYPHRMSFILNRYYFKFKYFRKIFNKIGAIPKKLFSPDIETIRRTMKSIKDGYPVLMCPEGRLSVNGENYYITKETGKLLKTLKVPVVITTINGAYITNPKWRKKRIKGPVHTEVKYIITKEQIETLSIDELNEIINTNIAYNDFEYARKNNITYRNNKKLEGAETILYRCPKCHQEYNLLSFKNKLTCQSCGFEVEADDNYSFKNNELGIKDFSEYYKKIIEIEENLINENGLDLSCEVDVKRFNFNDNIYDIKGEGTCRLTKEEFTFNGIVDGKETSFVIPVKQLFALAFSANEEFECYYGDELYYFYPKTNKLQCVKWALLVDLLNKEEITYGKQ